MESAPRSNAKGDSSSSSGGNAAESGIQALNDILDSRYEVLGVLGRGGMGTVLKGRHARLNKFVAIKMLNASLLVDDVSRQRFEIEAQAGSKLTHPNLISVFDYGFSKNNDPYLVMEFIEGVSLDRLLEDKRKPNFREMLDIFVQIAKALQYVHVNGIVHRDLKTTNIMMQEIGGEWHAKLLDFGIAKVFDVNGETANHLTATGSIYGSPLYMSPEQCQGHKIDGRSDLYSFGCIMYECMAGRPPIKGDNPLLTIFKQVNELPMPLPFANSGEEGLARIIERCLQKDPAMRFQSADEIIAALRKVPTAGKVDDRIVGDGSGVRSGVVEFKSGSTRRTDDGFKNLEGSTGPGQMDGSGSGASMGRQTNETLRGQGHRDRSNATHGSREYTEQFPRGQNTTRNVQPQQGSVSQAPPSFPWVGTVLKIAVGLMAISFIFNFFTISLPMYFNAQAHLPQLQQDVNASYERTHRELEKYNKRP